MQLSPQGHSQSWHNTTVNGHGSQSDFRVDAHHHREKPHGLLETPSNGGMDDALQDERTEVIGTHQHPKALERVARNAGGGPSDTPHVSCIRGLDPQKPSPGPRSRSRSRRRSSLWTASSALATKRAALGMIVVISWARRSARPGTSAAAPRSTPASSRR